MADQIDSEISALLDESGQPPLRLVTDAAPSLLAYIDNERRYRYNNRAYAEWFGRDRIRVIGLRMEEVLGEAAYRTIRAYVETALSGRKVTFEARVPYETGGTRYIQATYVPHRDPSGAVLGFIATITDITRLKETEEALRRSEEELNDFFENGAVGLHWVDSKGTILRANRAELDLLGYRAEEYVGRSITEFHADAPVIADILRRLTAGETLHNYEARLRCKDGTIRHVLISSNVLWDGDRFLHTRCFTRDITERKRAEEENVRLLKEVQQAAVRQRDFLRDVLFSVTEGKLHLCASAEELPSPLSTIDPPVALTELSLRTLRHQAVKAGVKQAFCPERLQDLETAVGEAAMNAVQHGGGGKGSVATGPTGGVQVRISDEGTGIDLHHLPRATLEPGYTTAGSMGYGFFLMLKSIDRLWLLTGPAGTTIVLEQDPTPAPPQWFRGLDGLEQ